MGQGIGELGLKQQMNGAEYWQVIVAVYGAVVGTAAISLEVRRWVESGPRFRISLMAPAQYFDGNDLGEDFKIAINAANIGDQPTTITHCVMYSYKSFFHRAIGKTDRQMLVMRPFLTGSAPNIPQLISPGEVWTGLINYDESLQNIVKNSRLFVGICSSHRKKPYLKIVLRRDLKRALELDAPAESL